MRTLGLDCSTQSLTGVVLDAGEPAPAATASVVYDRDLPEYGTENGQLPDPDPRIGRAPPLLWAAALDRVLESLAATTELASVEAVAVSGQQHGSVYLNERAKAALAALARTRDLPSQLEAALARPVSPIWTDSSTAEECAEIRESLGGAEATAELTGSDTFERFTGPQIRRFAKTEPEAWRATSSIALVSSFLTSILAGRIAAIDEGDGSGMNLMDIRSRRWSQRACQATWPGLRERLPPVVPCSTVVGPIAPYFRRYALGTGDRPCRVVVGSGDNPSSLIGVGAVSAGAVVISLGTSDTLFAVLREFRREPTGEGHVFVAPTGDPMALLCFRNGSLAREAVRDRHGLDWAGFERAVAETPPGNQGRGLVPWLEPEIVPRTPPGLAVGPHGFGGLEAASQGVEGSHDGRANAEHRSAEYRSAECRAILEGQALALKIHSDWMPSRPDRIRVTGGASRSRSLLQILADVFQCRVEVSEVSDSAAAGAALRARQAIASAPDDDWRRVVANGVAGDGLVVAPRAETATIYDDLAERYRRHEAALLAGA